MCPLTTELEPFNADAKSSSSESASPAGFVVGNGRPEGSLACVASWKRCALRSERVCSRVAFFASSANRRGLTDLVSEVVFEVVLGFGPSDDGGAVEGSVGLDDSCDWEDMLWVWQMEKSEAGRRFYKSNDLACSFCFFFDANGCVLNVMFREYSGI